MTWQALGKFFVVFWLAWTIGDIRISLKRSAKALEKLREMAAERRP